MSSSTGNLDGGACTHRLYGAHPRTSSTACHSLGQNALQHLLTWRALKQRYSKQMHFTGNAQARNAAGTPAYLACFSRSATQISGWKHVNTILRPSNESMTTLQRSSSTATQVLALIAPHAPAQARGIKAFFILQNGVYKSVELVVRLHHEVPGKKQCK